MELITLATVGLCAGAAFGFWQLYRPDGLMHLLLGVCFFITAVVLFVLLLGIAALVAAGLGVPVVPVAVALTAGVGVTAWLVSAKHH